MGLKLNRKKITGASEKETDTTGLIQPRIKLGSPIQAEPVQSTPKTYLPTIGERENSVVGQLVTDSRMAQRQESKDDNSLWKQTEKDREAYSQYTDKLMKDLQDQLTKYRADNDTAKIVETQDRLTKLQKETETHWTDRVTNTLTGALKQSVGAYGSAFAVNTEDMLDGGRVNVRGESMDKLSFDKDKALRYAQSVRDKTYSYSQSGVADLEQAKKGLGTLGRLGVDVASGLTQLGIDIGVGAATHLGAMPALAVRAFGGAADQARAEGANVDQQVMYGLASATVEVFTEKIASANVISTKAFGKGALDDVFDGIVAALEDTASTPNGRQIMNRVGSILVSGMGEGLEEGIAGVAEPFLSSGIYGKEFNMNWKDIGYQVLIGALTGAITGVSGQNTNDYRAKVAAANQNAAVPSVDSPAPVNYDKSTQQTIEKAQTADLGEPVVSKTATVLDTGTTAYLELGMKPKRAEAKAKVVQKLINGEQVSLDGMKSLNLTDAKYRAVFTQLTGVQFPEGVTNHDQLMNVARTASEVRNNVAAVEQVDPGTPVSVQTEVQEPIAQGIAQVSDEAGEMVDEETTFPSYEEFASIQKAEYPELTDEELRGQYEQFSAREQDTVNNAFGQPVTRAQWRKEAMRTNPSATAEMADAYFDEMRATEQQAAEKAAPAEDTGVGTTKTGGKGLYRDAKNEYQKVDKKTQKLLDEIGKRLGITVVIDSGLKIQSGDKKGEAARGHYSHETRTLRINPELGVSAVRTFRHELTHYIQDSKPEVYEKLVNVVKNHKQYDSIRAEVEGRYEGIESDESRIMDEVMAEYAEQMCTDEQFIELLAKTDRNLFEILMDAINEFFEKLKGIDPGLDAEVEQIKKLWADALKAAEKSNAKGRTDKGHYSFSSIASTFFGNENMTAADFESGDYKKTDGYKAYVKQCLDNMSQSRLDYDEKAARKEIEDSIDGIVRVALAMKKAGYDILDSKATRNVRDSKKRLLFSSLEPNSDYLTSSDISTICDKRKNFAAIYDDIVKAEEAKNVPKGKRFFDNVDNYFYLHKMMADKGLTQPCRQCYVESMRKNLAPMASAFLRLVNETDANNTANDQLYNQKGKTKGTLKTNNAKLRENVLNILSEYGMSASDLTVETLTTADGLATLKIQSPLVYEAFNSFYGQSKPKMPKAAVPFRFGELTALLTDDHGNIKTSLIDKIESTGGFRLQSYSDFQIQNFADVLQVIFEAGTLGLTGHAYTKVPAFLMATEGTGLKRNVSIFMYKDGNQWRIDKNDSFPGEVEDIYAIVESDTTGNTSIIAVSQNEDMSAWIMANDKVGYGIPFHKSGLKMGVVRDTVVREDGREIKGYTGTKDHTRQQTEVWAKTSEDHKALTKVSKGINIYEFWDFENADGLSRNELIEKNVKAYIDACEDRGYLPKFREYVMNNRRVLEITLSYAKQLGFVSQDAGIPDIAFEYKGYTIPYGYYKFLGDFGMFTPDGKASPHEALSLRNYNFDKAVQFFSDAETLRRNEILQQFANDGERQKYRDSGMTAEQLAEVAQQKRNEIVDEVVSGRYAAGEEAETYLDGLNIPTEVIFGTRYNELKNNGDIVDYNKAKDGDIEAALRLIQKYVTDEDVAKIAAFGSHVYLLPVQNNSGKSSNVIPLTLGSYISEATGQSVLDGVYQADYLNRRSKGNADRLNSPDVRFDVADEMVYNTLKGAKVVGIDDNTSYGSTLRGLAKFLQEHDAEMVGAYVLTVGGDNSESMVVTDQTWEAIKKEGVENVERYAREQGYSDAFTREHLGERRAQDFLSLYQKDKGRRQSHDRKKQGDHEADQAVHEGQQSAPQTLSGTEADLNKGTKASEKSGAFSMPSEGRNAVGGSDEVYLDAVKRGDMETAQRMVDEAARKNGYTPVKRYHQTAGGFTKFSTANPRAGLHDSETPNGIFFKDNDHDIGLEGKTQLQMYLKADNMLHFRNREEANKWYCNNVDGYATLQNEYNAALKPFLDELDKIEKKMFDSATTDDEYDALSEREENIIEEMREVEDSYRGQLRELLNEHFLNGTSGYDGIELDYDGHRWVNGKRENVHTYIVFDPAQAKSADPVTYDDNGDVIPLSQRFDSSNEDIRYAVDSNNVKLREDFIKEFDAKFGEGAAEKMYKTAESMRRAAKRAEVRTKSVEESAAVERTLAKKAKEDAITAWNIYHKKTLREKQRKYQEEKSKLYKAKAEAVADAIQTERAKADIRVQATEMNKGKHAAERERQLQERMMGEKAKAAERLRIEKDAYQADKQNRSKLQRNAAKSLIRDQKAVEKRRAQVEAEQGMVDTLRKNPRERTKAEKLQEQASALRTLGRSFYHNFVNQANVIDRFAKRQRGGVYASSLVNLLGGCGSTTERIFKDGLVDRSGNRIGESLKTVLLCMDVNGKKVDEAKQALLQDYMLHQHNIDRMSFVSNALKALDDFGSQHTWLVNLSTDELAKLVAATDAEVADSNRIKGKKGWTEADREVARQYHALLENYLVAEDKPVFGDSNGNPVTAETSREIVAKYEADHPWLVDKANGVYAWWDTFMRTWAVGDSLSLEEYERMRQTYPHYVPTYRVEKGGVGGAVHIGGTSASVSKATQKAKGSMLEIAKIEDSFANIASKVIRLARNNELFMNIIDTAMMDEEDIFSDLAVFDWGWQDGAYENTLRTQAILNGETQSEIEEAAKAGLNLDGGAYRLTGWKNGRKYSAILSKDLFQSISDVTGHSVNDFERTVLKVGNALTGPMKTAITGINPFFAVRNLSRDIPSAIINSTGGKFPKYWAQALAEMKSNSDNWQVFQSLGGTHAGYYNNEKGFADAMSRGPGIVASAVDKLGAINNVTEAATRFAEYLSTIDRMGNTYEARVQGIKNSAEVTVDFSRKGRIGKFINVYVPYWNPAVQGVDKLVRSVVDSPEGAPVWKQAMKTGSRAVMCTVLWEAVLQAVLHALDRDDEWEELTDRDKAQYYCIPLPDHKFLKIAKNREWGAILGTPFMLMLEGLDGRPDPFRNYVETSLEPNFLPGAIFRPNLKDGSFDTDIILLGTKSDLDRNKDFAGRDIVPYAQQQGTKAEQYDAETGMIARHLGKLINFSPMQIDYIIQDYFGDFGQVFLTDLTAPATWASDKTPMDFVKSAADAFAGSFIVDNRYSNQAVSDYYDTLDELSKVVNDKKNQMGSEAYKETKEYKTQKALQEMYGNQISDLNKEVRGLPDGEEKDAAKEQIKSLAGQALEFYKDCMSGEVQEPHLVAEYANLPSVVGNELIRLKGFNADYDFEPTDYKPSKYTDPDDKKREYVLDDGDKEQYRSTYSRVYGEVMQETMSTSKYQKASDLDKVEMLEEARDSVAELTKEEFLGWLASTRRSTEKSK